MIPYILGLLIMGVLLWLVLKPSRPTIDSRTVDAYWDDGEPIAPAPAPLYEVGDRVVFRYNWWAWRGENTVWVSYRPVERSVFEEFRTEVWAEVAGVSGSNLNLIYAGGESYIPLSVCDGSNRITHYEAPDPQWIVKSQWAREWIGVASD